MADVTLTRSREQEPALGLKYEIAYANRGKFVEHANNGVIVVRDSDREWEVSRQGYQKWYLMHEAFPETVLDDWVLFVLEGKGATECNGEIIEWEEGDCILLPFHPDGLDHRHFNRGEGPTKWVAFIHMPTWNHVASELNQLEDMKDYKQQSSR